MKFHFIHDWKIWKKGVNIIHSMLPNGKVVIREQSIQVRECKICGLTKIKKSESK
jgi:hypothetical protein